MIKAAIIDDEPLAHEVIKAYACEIPWLTIQAQYYSATEALSALSNNEFDLIFLDIQMPVLTGIELLRVLKNKPQVILTTAYQEYALESYELEVTDYLLKPFKMERFLQAINKIKSNLEKEISSQTQDDNKPVSVSVKEAVPDTIFIKVDKKQLQINLQDIELLEAYGNYVKVWCGENCKLTPRTLTSFEQSLPTMVFVRVHKSFIVNRKAIEFIEGDKLNLRNGLQVPIGKQFKQNLVLGD